MLLLKALVTGLKTSKGFDLSLLVGVLGLVVWGAFAQAGKLRAEQALRTELADLNIRQAEHANKHYEAMSALAEVSARVSALEREITSVSTAKADVAETGTIATAAVDQPPLQGKPAKAKRARR